MALPAAITPTMANCDAPVNITRERAQVCQMLNPAETEMAPKESP